MKKKISQDYQKLFNLDCDPLIIIDELIRNTMSVN